VRALLSGIQVCKAARELPLHALFVAKVTFSRRPVVVWYTNQSLLLILLAFLLGLLVGYLWWGLRLRRVRSSESTAEATTPKSITSESPAPTIPAQSEPAAAEPVVAEPEPVAVEPEPVVAEPEPVVAEPEPVVAEDGARAGRDRGRRPGAGDRRGT
jgi:hypothetical protein